MVGAQAFRLLLFGCVPTMAPTGTATATGREDEPAAAVGGACAMPAAGAGGVPAPTPPCTAAANAAESSAMVADPAGVSAMLDVRCRHPRAEMRTEAKPVFFLVSLSKVGR